MEHLLKDHLRSFFRNKTLGELRDYDTRQGFASGRIPIWQISYQISQQHGITDNDKLDEIEDRLEEMIHEQWLEDFFYEELDQTWQSKERYENPNKHFGMSMQSLAGF